MMTLHEYIVLISFAIPTICSGARTVYDYSAKDIRGDIVNFKSYEGQVLLIVNVASQCGFTDNHYTQLVQLQESFGTSQKFSVLAFPCNQFGFQEPDDEHNIYKFATERYQVNFPLFSKVNVKDHDVPDLWTFLTEKSGYTPDWNFWKYLINHKGEVLNAWGPRTDVNSIYNDVAAAVNKAINESQKFHSPRSGDKRDEI